MTVSICNISLTGSAQPCNTKDNTYNAVIIATYAFAPATGTLDVNGQSFAITTSPQTIILPNLVADGNPVNVTANFSAEPTCSSTVEALFTAPVACDCCPQKYQVFDGTNWVDPCDCTVNIMDSSNTWQLLDPANCPTSFWDGTRWVLIECCPPPPPASWNCISPGICLDPSDGTGTYSTLSACNEACPPIPPEPVISSKTEINIFFDSSGSMNESLQPLKSMRDNYLKDCLLPYYNNDPVLYDERVKVGIVQERTIENIATPRNANLPQATARAVDLTVDLVLNLTFCDESTGTLTTQYWDSTLHPTLPASFDTSVPLEPGYLTDLTTAQNIADNAPLDPNPYEVRGTFFRVIYNSTLFDAWQRGFIDALFNSSNLFTPPNNLANYQANYNAELDVLKGQTVTRPTVYGTSIYSASRGVDWTVGLYPNSPITTVSGNGSGMTGKIDVLAEVGVATIVATNITGTTTFPAGTINTALVGTGIFSAFIEVTIDGLGNVTINPNVIESGRYATVGAVGSISLAGGWSADIEVLTTVAYTSANLLTIDDYGDDLYTGASSLELGPPVGAGGTTVLPLDISQGLGSAPYYLDTVVTALNNLGIVITCPP